MPYTVENSKIQLGLSQLPDDNLPKNLYGTFLQIYLAIQNLLRGVSQYTGIDAPPADTWGSVSFSDSLLTGNASRIYVPASVVIARGQVVNLHNNAGVLNARLAQANSATTMAHGVANSAGGIGTVIEINYLQGWIDSIGGMTVGELYYLSPAVAGAVQNVRPFGAGQIIQPIGVALTSSQMALAASLAYIQL
jgi:hypothetical protein